MAALYTTWMRKGSHTPDSIIADIITFDLKDDMDGGGLQLAPLELGRRACARARLLRQSLEIT